MSVTREELDQSLFEYEQFKKNAFKPKLKKDLNKITSRLQVNSSILNELLSADLLSSIEESLVEKKKENFDLNLIQNEFIILKNQNSAKLNILEMKLKFKAELAAQTNKETPGKKDKISKEVFDLKEMYKWKKVDEKIKKPTAEPKTAGSEMSLDQQWIAYAHYYNYYFKAFLKNALNSNQT